MNLRYRYEDTFCRSCGHVYDKNNQAFVLNFEGWWWGPLCWNLLFSFFIYFSYI